MGDIKFKKNQISLRGISKTFGKGHGKLEVLKQVDLDIESGESIAVVGASGIGKSTLLHIAGTLDLPDSGELLYSGENILKLNDKKLAAFRNSFIGFVFQFHHLLPEFTALENVAMPLIIRGTAKEEAEEKGIKILDRVGLKKRIYHKATELSGGEQQRVAIARAVVIEPMVLLADEPTGNLDRKNSQQIHELINQMNVEEKMTLMVVTHNMELADYMKRQVTLTEGNLIEKQE
jgi:lipoprotein-releasing system ATP-binding protein